MGRLLDHGKVTAKKLEHQIYNSITFVTQLEYPCEGRPSSTVPWEGRVEILLPEPISGHAKLTGFNNLMQK